ncbi:Kinesin-4 [Platanthera guangdongensis]|uniref:Kinesin-4 n=1 Tax=Platanthera guangdongensis TaxID=2320717 RepID=A0ABR2LHY7_9ASPA
MEKKGSNLIRSMAHQLLKSGPDSPTEDVWGVNYRALNDLFHISQSRRNSILYEVGVQMIEIYNEQVRDLLANDPSQKKYPLNILAPHIAENEIGCPFESKSLVNFEKKTNLESPNRSREFVVGRRREKYHARNLHSREGQVRSKKTLGLGGVLPADYFSSDKGEENPRLGRRSSTRSQREGVWGSVLSVVFFNASEEELKAFPAKPNLEERRIRGFGARGHSTEEE